MFARIKDCVASFLLSLFVFVAVLFLVVGIQAALAESAKDPLSADNPAPGSTRFTEQIFQSASDTEPTSGIRSVVIPEVSGMNVRGVLINQAGTAGETAKTNPLQLYDNVQVWGRLNSISGLTNTGVNLAP